MACGCKGAKAGPLPQVAHQPRTAGYTARVAVYEVVKDAKVVLSTSSPVAARQEAKRLSASVRVTSRPTSGGEQQALAG